MVMFIPGMQQHWLELYVALLITSHLYCLMMIAMIVVIDLLSQTRPQAQTTHAYMYTCVFVPGTNGCNVYVMSSDLYLD